MACRYFYLFIYHMKNNTWTIFFYILSYKKKTFPSCIFEKTKNISKADDKMYTKFVKSSVLCVKSFGI